MIIFNNVPFTSQVEDIKSHFSVVAEGLEHKIPLVAEGIENVDEKLERFAMRSKKNSKKPDL